MRKVLPFIFVLLLTVSARAATCTWIGGALAKQQVSSATVGGTIESDDVWLVSLANRNGSASLTISTTGGSTVAATVATTVTAALAASTNPEFRKCEFTVSGAVIYVTAKEAGVPFSITVSTTEAGGGGADAQTFTLATVTANQGPADWNDPSNWAGLAKPTTDDVVQIEGSAPILYGLNQSGAGTFGAVTVSNSAQIGSEGLPLRFVATSVNVFGSSNYFLEPNAGTTAIPVRVTSGSTYLTGVLSTASVEGGTLNVATNPGDTCTVATIDQNGGSVTAGSGTTLTTWHCNAGTGVLRAAATTVTSYIGARFSTFGSGAITTFNCYGSLVSNSSGTITTLNIDYNGVADFTKSRVSRTVSTTNLMKGRLVRDQAVLSTPIVNQEAGGSQTPGL